MKELATECAKRSQILDFDRKFGVETAKELEPARLYFFNNNPYKKNLTIADKQRAEFIRRLGLIDIVELGYGEYPERGPDEGYSYAIILDAAPTKSNKEKVMEIWNDVFSNFGWDEAE